MKNKVFRNLTSRLNLAIRLVVVCLFAVLASNALAQTKTITGTVLDPNGESIIGASVSVVGTTQGVITDVDGKFSLTNIKDNANLKISYVGYKTQQVSVAGKSSIKVTLTEDVAMLEEVVAIGYGTVKKRDLTGAIVSIKSDDIVTNPNANPMQALQGKVAGLDITKSSGQAGAGVTMQLRGTRSFSASGNPLFIIDGMPGDYNTLNPNDIESIEVLKDASSTAIYGSAGANGVILITTKSGKEGKVAVNFNAYVGVNGWAETPAMRSGESYINTLRQAYTAANGAAPSNDEAVFGTQELYNAHVNGQYIDWVDALLKTAITQNYSVSVSGGNDKTKAYMSLNFSDEQGQFSGDDYKVYSSKMRIDHQAKRWLKIGTDMQLSFVYQNKAESDLQGLMTATPLGTLYNEDDTVNPEPIVNGSNTYNYLLNNGENYKNQSQNLKLYFNPYIEIRPLKGLTLQSRLGAALAYNRSNLFQGKGSVYYYKNNEATRAQVKNDRSYNYKWENILSYNFKVAEDHDITLTGVTTWNHNQSDYTTLYQNGIDENKFLWHNITDDSSTSGTTKYTMSKGMGYVGRINYSYKGRYLFAASVRRDGSSRLAEGNRWDTFPAVSLGWRVSDESFMKATEEWLDNLKIRAGYGVTGTAGIDPYSSAASLDSKVIAMSLGGVYTPVNIFSQNIPNYNLGWEKSYNTNVGIDASFLHNRIDVSMEYYNTDTKDVIWNRSLPVTNGAYGVDGGANSTFKTYVNVCETSNKGFEMTLNTRNIETKDFRWTSSLSFNYNKEEITKLAIDKTSNSDEVKPITNGDTGYALALGEAVNSFYHYKIDGIWQTNEADEAACFGAKPGDYKINVKGMHKGQDENGVYYYKDNDLDDEGNPKHYTKDNKYTVGGNDYQILGHNTPDWTLGFQNNFYYKGFDLGIFAYVRWGQMINYSLLGSYDPTGQKNFPKYFNYWTEDNPSNDFPAINANNKIDTYTGWYARTYVDGSFIKIKNITLGYTLPKNLLQKAGMEKCRIYATLTNPFVWAKSDLIKDYDPEQNGSMKYPLTKQLVFGVNISF